MLYFLPHCWLLLGFQRHKQEYASDDREYPMPGIVAALTGMGFRESASERAPCLVHRLAYNGDVVAFKMGRRQGVRRAHISIDT
jgi:hypothetical protein